MIPTPIAFGLTICEKVIVEEQSRNVSLINTFTKLNLATLAFPPSFVVYAVLTDGLGAGRIKLGVIGSETGDEIYSRQVVLTFRDRLVEERVLFRVNQCSFPASGKYQITLSVDGELVAQRQLLITVRKDPS